MTEIPVVTIYVRHSTDCEHRDDEQYRRCRCRKHLRWTWEGKQYRRTAKTRSWEQAERAKRELELQYETVQIDRPVEKDKPVTVERSIQIFLANKKGAKADDTTVAKYQLTLSRLQEFCDRQGLLFVREIKLEHLSTWRETWSSYYGSNFSLRNSQSRLRHFFRYCHNAGLIGDNPAAKLSAIKISDDDYEVDPYTEKQYEPILKAIPNCENIGAANRERVRAMMQLQRWSGLSLVDAVCLEKGELVKDGQTLSS